MLGTSSQKVQTTTTVYYSKITKALKMIQEGRWTIRGAAKFAGLTYGEILGKMTDSGVDSGPTLKDLREAWKQDPIFIRPPVAPKTGKKERTSEEHDKYLYGKTPRP